MSLYLWWTEKHNFYNLETTVLKEMIWFLAVHLVEILELISTRLGKQILRNTYNSYKVSTLPLERVSAIIQKRIGVISHDQVRWIVLCSEPVKTMSRWTLGKHLWGFCRHRLPILWVMCKVILERLLMLRGQGWGVGIKEPDVLGKEGILCLGLTGGAWNRIMWCATHLREIVPWGTWRSLLLAFMSWRKWGEGMV